MFQEVRRVWVKEGAGQVKRLVNWRLEREAGCLEKRLGREQPSFADVGRPIKEPDC